jgi:hypothetical protein
VYTLPDSAFEIVGPQKQAALDLGKPQDLQRPRPVSQRGTIGAAEGAPTSHPASNSTLGSTALRSTVRSKRCGLKSAAVAWVFGSVAR